MNPYKRTAKNINKIVCWLSNPRHDDSYDDVNIPKKTTLGNFPEVVDGGFYVFKGRLKPYLSKKDGMRFYFKNHWPVVAILKNQGRELLLEKMACLWGANMPDTLSEKRIMDFYESLAKEVGVKYEK